MLQEVPVYKRPSHKYLKFYTVQSTWVTASDYHVLPPISVCKVLTSRTHNHQFQSFYQFSEDLHSAASYALPQQMKLKNQDHVLTFF